MTGMRCLRQIIYCPAGRQLVVGKKGGIRPESADVSSRWKPGFCSRARTNGGELPAGAATPDNREQASAPPGTPGMPTPDNQEVAIPDTWSTGALQQVPRGSIW